MFSDAALNKLYWDVELYSLFFSVEDEIRKLAEEISTEDDDDEEGLELKLDRPLRILKIIRGLVKNGDLVNQKRNYTEKKETST